MSGKPKQPPTPYYLRVRFTTVDAKLLARVSQTEQISRVEVIRRALREYALRAIPRAQEQQRLLKDLQTSGR